MYPDKKHLLILIAIFLFLSLAAAENRAVVIEDFNDGNVQLSSWLDEDQDPNSWQITTSNPSSDPPYSLKLTGNTWKVQSIDPIQIDSTSVWAVSANCTNLGEIQGIGFSDGENHIYYSFWGQQELNIEYWIPVYQGNFDTNSWQDFLLPISDDWFAWYEYYPSISEIIYINDNDSGSGTLYLDWIRNISEDLPIIPQVSISWEQGEIIRDNDGNRWIDFNFFSFIDDPDSDQFDYLWQFGDDSLSTESDPTHMFLIEDDHTYTVVLEVTDESGMVGRAITNIQVEEGESSLPLTMNFVGDIMLARGISDLINNGYGEELFNPTMPILGDAADISVANLECPLTNCSEHHPTKTIWFKGYPEYAQYLQYSGIDIVSLANNHTLDYMLPGLLETQQALDTYGILYSGANINSYEAYQPLFYNKKGVNIAFLASSDRTGQYNNYQPYLQAGYNKPGFAYLTPYYLEQQINEVREIADLVVVEMHAGSEYSTEPGDNYDAVEEDDQYPEEDYHTYADIPHMWDYEIRHHAVDEGADLVIVHHPHVIQGFEVYQNKLIAHSLGNFLFDLTYSETMPSVILSAWADQNAFTNYSIKPVFIDDWIPQPATGQLGLYILDHLAMNSRQMGTIINIDRENISGEILLDSLNINQYNQSHELIIPLDLDLLGSRSEPVKLPHNGSLSMIQEIIPATDWEYRLGRDLIWFGNFETEGCSLWDINDDDEFYTDMQSHTGEQSLCQVRDSNDNNNIITDFEHRIKVRPASSHTIYGWVKTSNSNSVYLEANYYNSRNNGYPVSSQQIEIDIPTNSDWTFYFQELEIPANGNYLDLDLSSDNPVFNNATTWFDDVGIIAWDEWNTYNPPQEILSPNDYYFMQIKSNYPLTEAQLSFTESQYQSGPIVHSDDYSIPPASECSLGKSYPNPFITSTTSRGSATRIDFQIYTTTSTTLELFNIKGQKIRTLVNEKLEPGSYKTDWNGADNFGRKVATGIYFYRLKTKKSEISRKLLILK